MKLVSYTCLAGCRHTEIDKLHKTPVWYVGSLRYLRGHDIRLDCPVCLLAAGIDQALRSRISRRGAAVSPFPTIKCHCTADYG